MFRQGRTRTFRHNLRLASMLSLVAGIVNIIGVLSIGTLTTNVTGHFAFFSEEFVQHEFPRAMVFMMYTVFFLGGAFVCGLLIEIVMRRRPSISHAAPMLVEMLVLVAVGVSATDPIRYPVAVACALLFAMGLQNALVTKISKATVRTTHLTGLFTDLGIELSQLLFYRSSDEVKILAKSIYLRLAIIMSFFMGGVLGGLLFHLLEIRALLFASAFLLVALMYDNIRFVMHRSMRRIHAFSRRPGV